MKKHARRLIIGRFLLMLCAALCVGLLPTVVLAAEDDTTVAYAVTGGNIYFDKATGKVTDCDYDVTVVDIPSKIDGVTVTGIDAWAFKGMENLKSITIPEGIISIENYAFEDCTSLQEVLLPDSLEILGPSVFVNCKNLEHVVIQSETQMTGNNFSGCEKLISAGPIGGNYNIEFGWDEFIPDYAFSCSELHSIVFPNGILKIGDEAFYECDSLADISIPSSVKAIGKNAFYGCDCAPSEINLPEGLQTIGAGAFGAWDNVKEIIVPDSVTFIGFEAFCSCDALEHIVIPSSVSCDGCMFSFCPKLNSAGPIGGNYNIEFGWTEEIPDYAFCGMGTVTLGKAYLESVVLPDSITRIGDSAFEDCTELKSIEIPAAVTEIGDSAFRNCQSLKEIKIPSNLKTVDTFVFSDCDNLKNVVISDGVQNLENMSFGFANFTSIFLPKSIQRIDGAFELSNLTDVYYAGSEDEWNQIEIKYGLNDSLEDATIHFNSVGKEDTYSVSVRFLSSWDSTTRQTTFGSGERFSPYTYTLLENMDTINVETLLNKYVLLTMEQDENDVLEYTVTDIQPVESAVGTVSATGEHSLTIDGTEYPVREDFILGSCEGQEILYHICDGTIVGFDELEEKSGTLDAWDSATGRVTIEGTTYPTNYMSDLSFQNDIDQYIGQKINYSVSGSDDYEPLIRIDGLMETESNIAVFSTEKSLTVQTGSSMWLGFGKISDGQIAEDWSKMAVVVSDPTVISLSDYEETEYGYSLEVIGKKEGITNVTITDTESGASTIIAVTVSDSYVGTYSYAIDSMESFYPSNGWEGTTQTNIYNLNGLYVNNYHESKTGDVYTVSFDVYNSRYHTGAVDIYDADGNWIDCEEVKKFSEISNLWDTGEQAYYLISDAVNGKLLTYEQASFAKHTPISIEVPDGGYFTISNNFAESPGTYLFNSCEIIFDATCTLIDAAADVKNDDVVLSKLSNSIKEKIIENKTVREKFIDIFKDTVKDEIRDCLKNFAINEVDDKYSDISGLSENLWNSLDLDWKHLFRSATGVAESAFTKFAGPAGDALEGCFAFAKGTNKLVQAVHLAASIDAPYATVFSSISDGEINPHGVIVNTNGNMDTEAVLQVFRVSNNNTIEIVLGDDSDDRLTQYELYNICFVKDDQLVQPSGKVTVRIPIPDGMNGDTCNVYRQEADGSWTIITAHIEGNYLVFETDHFSLYAVVGDVGGLSIASLPDKMQYVEGDILDTEGLELSLDGTTISGGYVCDPTVLSQAGEQKVTVKYGSASTEFTVLVNESAEPDSSGGGSGSGSGGSSSSGGSGAAGSSSDGVTTDDSDTGNTTTPATSSFADVADNSYYYDAVQWAVENGITTGTTATTFSPDATCTRAQAVTFLWRTAGNPEPTGSENPFTDVSESAYYYKAVLWAIEQGITVGTGSTTFSPDATCTRAQIVTMLYRAAGSTAAGSGSFTDVPATAYYYNAVAWAVSEGIATGTGDNRFSPDDSCTRGQIVTFLYRGAQ